MIEFFPPAGLPATSGSTTGPINPLSLEAVKILTAREQLRLMREQGMTSETGTSRPTPDHPGLLPISERMSAAGLTDVVQNFFRQG